MMSELFCYSARFASCFICSRALCTNQTSSRFFLFFCFSLQGHSYLSNFFARFSLKIFDRSEDYLPNLPFLRPSIFKI